MTRLLYLPDESTVIQLEVDLTPAELMTAVNAGMRPLPVLRSGPPGKLTACQVNTTVVIAPLRNPIHTGKKSTESQLTRRQKQVFELSNRGFTTLEIAGMLSLSRRAVNYHLNQARNRLRGGFSQQTIEDNNEDQ
jgi:DNA-binding CsgD family transcriptional regulator